MGPPRMGGSPNGDRGAGGSALRSTGLGGFRHSAIRQREPRLQNLAASSVSDSRLRSPTAMPFLLRVGPVPHPWEWGALVCRGQSHMTTPGLAVGTPGETRRCHLWKGELSSLSGLPTEPSRRVHELPQQRGQPPPGSHVPTEHPLQEPAGPTGRQCHTRALTLPQHHPGCLPF